MQKSKNELKAEFEQFEKEIEIISNKYDSKLMEITKQIVNEDEIAVDDISETDFEDFSIETEEMIAIFVESYEEYHPKTDLDSVLNDFKQEYLKNLNESETKAEKEYTETLYKMDLETAGIENKMYNVAKAYLN